MKKILVLILSVLFITTAKASSIDTIDMDIKLDYFGNATITETWKADVHEGTEGYHPYFNLGYSHIEVLSASMDGEEYDVVAYWSESASLSDKAYKASIYRTRDETDVVFGISKYGSHTYKVTYKITNFVSNIEDADIIYWNLFPYDFSLEPNNVTIKISGPYEYPDTLDVWGYGLYEAPCYVKDGAIYMTSNGSISSSEYLTILAKFPKGTFNTTSKYDHDFDYYKDMADEGADVPSINNSSNRNKALTIIGAILGFLFNMLFIIFIPVFFIRLGKAKNSTYDFGGDDQKLKDTPNFREIPCDKDIYEAFFIADLYNLNKSNNDFMGALLLKWIYNGNVEVNTITKKKFLGEKEEDTIVFKQKPVDAPTQEVNLYNYMFEASLDGVLEKNEFKKWCSKHYDKMLNWSKKVLDYEKDELIKKNYLIDNSYEKGLLFKYKVKKYTVTDKLKEEAKKLKGLKLFLIKFSEIKTREPIEVKLWNEYLMYAQIFGIAEKVMNKFKELYPDVIKDMDNYHFNYDTFIFLNSVSTTGYKTATSRSNYNTGGYSGGGGGFSSGGGGGGSFGGGGGGGGFR